MNKRNGKLITILTGILLLLFALPVSADSSWAWITKTRPYDVLPFVVVGTLLIETASINYIPRIKKLKKVFGVVALGNVLSYAAPYIVKLLGSFTNQSVYNFTESLERMPFYTVGIVYLVITIAVELPIEYFMLRKDTEKRWILLFTVIGANIVTTALVAVIERTLCYGQYA